MDANARAAKGREAVEHFKSDKARIHELRHQMVALTEWAVTASAAKEALLEKNIELENQLMKLLNDKRRQGGDIPLMDTRVAGKMATFGQSLLATERTLWLHSSSVVIGAGYVMSLFSITL